MARPASPHVRIDLIAAAQQVFAREGLDAARVEDITAAAGCSKGAFYQHFASKEQLFLQIVETLVARIQRELSRRVIRRAERFTGEWLRSLWLERDLAILELVWQERDIVRIVLEGGRSASSAHLMDAFAARVRQTCDEFLVWGLEAGLCRPELDVATTSLFIAGAYDQLARDLVKRPTRPDLTVLAQRIQDFVLNAVSDRSVNNQE
jgi:AcrR family transcriptional regulator